MTDDLKDALDAAWSERVAVLTAEIARLRMALAESEAAAEGALMILVQTQAERDAALAQVATAITGNKSGTICRDCRNVGMTHCSDPFNCGGMQPYTVEELIAALSRRDAQMRAEGRKDGLREAAAMCDDTAQEALEESGAESRAIWTWFRGQRDAILAAAEKEAPHGGQPSRG